MTTANSSSSLRAGNALSIGATIECLIDEGLVASEQIGQLRSLRDSRESTAIHPLIRVAGLHLKTPQDEELDIDRLTAWLGEKSRMPVYRIDPMDVDVEAVTKVVSQTYARQYKMLPVEVHSHEVVVATSEPFHLDWLKDLAPILRKEVRVVVANPLDVARFLNEFWGVSRSVKRATDLKMRGDSEKILNFEQLLDLGSAGQLNADDQHIVYIVDWLLQYAFDQRASDIHLEPRRERSNVRFRIDGKLHTVYQLPTPVMGAVVARIKVLGRMDVAEKRRPQDGRLKTRSQAGREVELRLSTMPTAFGEKCVMRIFDPDVVALSFSELGFGPRELKIWQHMVERPHGVVLVTGPTGSGKTTTLYSTLRHLATPDINVCTVEDPIEMVLSDFNQMQVQSSIGVDFANGVRTLLRQDPDVIMIGEIRDLETAQMAVQASLTGHMVLSTLHTNDAPSAITRLVDLGIPHYLLRGTLVGVVAQRLMRRLCGNCKTPGPIDSDAWDALTGRFKVPAPEQGFVANGCETCRNTGYRGRTAIYEMMPLNDELSSHITGDVDLANLSREAIRAGMRPLRIAAASRVADGTSTVEEAARVIPPDSY